MNILYVNAYVCTMKLAKLSSFLITEFTVTEFLRDEDLQYVCFLSYTILVEFLNEHEFFKIN